MSATHQLGVSTSIEQLRILRHLNASPNTDLSGSGSCPFPVLGGYPLGNTGIVSASDYMFVSEAFGTPGVVMADVCEDQFGHLVAVGSGDVWRSRNNGLSWRLMASGAFGDRARTFGAFILVTGSQKMWRFTNGNPRIYASTAIAGQLPWCLAEFNATAYVGCMGYWPSGWLPSIHSSSDGITWNLLATPVADPDFSVEALAGLNDALYAGIQYSSGYIYRSTDGSAFVLDGDISPYGARAFVDHEGGVYAVAITTPANTRILRRTAPGTWDVVTTIAGYFSLSMVSFGGYLYVALYNGVARVVRYNATGVSDFEQEFAGASYLRLFVKDATLYAIDIIAGALWKLTQVVY